MLNSHKRVRLNDDIYYEYSSTSHEALTSLVDHVNAIIGILRKPEDCNLFKSSNFNSAISKPEMDEVISHSLEATSKLMQISRSYMEVQDTNFLKCEDDVEVSTPDIYDSQNDLYQHRDSQDLNLYEFEAEVDSSRVSVGSRFETLKDAEAAFQEYAMKCGFNICKGNSKKNQYQELACSARGRARNRNTDSNNRLRRRNSIKAMCKCHIVIRKREEGWEITSARLSHTHKLLSKEELLMTPKNRFIPDDIKKVAIKLYQEGSSPARIQEFLETQSGAECTWTMKDLYNLLYRYRRH